MNLLFVTATRLGDVVLSTGLLGALLDRHPGARVTVAAGPAGAPILASVPGLHRLIVLRKRPYAGHWRRLWLETVTRRWDLAVDLRGTALTWILPVRHRLVVRRRALDEHRVVELGRLIGRDPPPAPRLWPTGGDLSEAAALLPGDGPVLALGPTTNWGGKTWPAERFAALARRLTDPGGAMAGARVAVFGAAHERPQAEPVLAAIAPDRRIDLVGRIGLPVVAAALARSTLFVGNDSGLMHLAAAAGTPTLGLFGPSPERRYGPWGAHCAVVRTRESYEELVGAPGFDHLAQATLMGSLDVDRAVAAAEALYRRTRGR